MSNLMKPLRSLLFHLHTLHLFTRSDLKIFILPSTIFALAHIHVLHSTDIFTTLSHLAPILLYLYLAVIPLDINNQRLPHAIAEDALNKPWRPLPTKRLTSKTARQLVYVFYMLHILYSAIAGGLVPAILLIFLGTWYSIYRGGESSPVVRHFINAAGFLCFLSGALHVAAGGNGTLYGDTMLRKWLGIIFGIVFSTIQVQDLRDEEGDKASRKKTLPVFVGDTATRWSLALLVPLWTYVVVSFWDAGGLGVWMDAGLALLLAGRTIMWRTQKDDKKTLLVWNAWLCWIYVTPLSTKAHSRQ